MTMASDHENLWSVFQAGAELVYSGSWVANAAQDLGVTPQLIYYWRDGRRSMSDHHVSAIKVLLQSTWPRMLSERHEAISQLFGDLERRSGAEGFQGRIDGSGGPHTGSKHTKRSGGGVEPVGD